MKYKLTKEKLEIFFENKGEMIAIANVIDGFQESWKGYIPKDIYDIYEIIFNIRSDIENMTWRK